LDGAERGAPKDCPGTANAGRHRHDIPAECHLGALLGDLANVTQHQVDKARGILKDLLGEEIVLHPMADEVEGYLTAEIAGDYSGVTAVGR
jgi:hypothetical protein